MYNMVILFDRFNLPEDIYEIIFATKQQIIVAKLLIGMIKDKDCEITKTEMSFFASLFWGACFILCLITDIKYATRSIK